MTRVFVQFNKSKKPENLKKIYQSSEHKCTTQKKNRKKQWNKREIITVE